MAERQRIIIDTEQIIYKKDEPSALVGFDAEDSQYNIEGWKWDDRQWTTDEQENQAAVLPTLYDSKKLGLTPDFFQSGIGQGDDLKIIEIEEARLDGREIWTAKVRHGEYFNRQNRRYLYSDDSVIQYIDPLENESDRNTLQLDYKLKETVPISIETYKRDIDTDNFKVYSSIDPKLQFTGKLDSDGNELPTLENGAILWDNVDTDRWEAVVMYDLEPEKIIFNKDFNEQIGRELTFFAERNILERMGETNDGVASVVFRTKYFPILRDDSLHVYIVDETNGTFIEWTRVNSFKNSSPTDTHYVVDRDLGWITFGDNVYGAIPPLFRSVYITYTLTYKIEYEADGTADTILVQDINLNPTSNSTSNGFIFLTETKINIGSIILNTNESPFPGLDNVYGPITMGNDYGVLTATVLDTVNEPIPDIEVTFRIENLPVIGNLNGLGATVTATTNSRGQAVVFYNAPSVMEELGYYAVNLEDENKTLVLDNVDANLIDTQQIYLFQVRKDDPLFGKVGADVSIGEIPFDIEYNPLKIYGRKTIVYNYNEEAIHPRTGELGAFFPMQPETLDSGFKLNFSEPLFPPDPSKTDNENPVAGYWVLSTCY
jgi:hypothetical protein